MAESNPDAPDEGTEQKGSRVEGSRVEGSQVSQDKRVGETSGSVRNELPPIDFTTFVLSLSTSVLVQLGQVSAPGEKVLGKNLPVARQTIDVLEMLEEKTRGNLSGEEERLLQQILADLRLRYVSCCE